MTNILFVCHGNVGRSPMAMFIFQDMVNKRGLGDSYVIRSAGTSGEVIGMSMYPLAQEKLVEHRIPCKGHSASQMSEAAYDYYDMIICMDLQNIRDLYKLTDNDPEGKISMLLDHTDRKGEEIADPWYTRGFDASWRDIKEGCEGLMAELEG